MTRRETAETPSRRTFLKALGTAAAAVGMGGVAAGQDVATTYRLGGRVSGWQGQSPESISGATNPTLQLEAGTQYEVVWENLDGAPHNFVIMDSNGNTLASTETMSNEGETRSLTFTASSEMARYICTIHPTTMVGDVEVSGGQAGAGNQTTATTTTTETTTAAEATTTTETTTEEEVPAEETPTDGQPGFGVIAAITSVVGGAGYLLSRRKDSE